MPKLILKGQAILAESGEPNAHRLALKSKVSYPTVERYVNRPEDLNGYASSVLASLLIDGLGLTPEEILARPMSDFFEFGD